MTHRSAQMFYDLVLKLAALGPSVLTTGAQTNPAASPAASVVPAAPTPSAMPPSAAHAPVVEAAPVRYGLLDAPIIVSLTAMREAIAAADSAGLSKPIGPLQKGATPVLFSLYVGDASEVGPRGGKRPPAFCIALYDDQANRDAGIDPDVLKLTFPTRRNQIFLIVSRDEPEVDGLVYRYDVAQQRVDAVRYLASYDRGHDYQAQGMYSGVEWLKRCLHRRDLGGREDYRLSEDPTVFADCRSRFNYIERVAPQDAPPQASPKRPDIVWAEPGTVRRDVDQDLALRERYGAIAAHVELVPEPCWYANLRAVLPHATWVSLSNRVRDAADWQCEACGATPDHKHLHAHERWIYDDERRIQHLDGIDSLCADCHEIRHLGLATIKGRGRVVTERLLMMNDWSTDVGNRYLMEVQRQWQERSRVAWKLDISWLEATHGITRADLKVRYAADGEGDHDLP